MTYQQKLDKIEAAIKPHLRQGLNARVYAIAILDEAEDDQTHFEVRRFHTKSGNPFTFTI